MIDYRTNGCEECEEIENFCNECWFSLSNKEQQEVIKLSGKMKEIIKSS